jgi:hypothetical protein
MMRGGIKLKCRDRESLLFLCKVTWIFIHACRRHPSVCTKVQWGGIAHITDIAHKA